jgi:cyclophilin family peptidyl-prolyl cis-trans isomerase
MGDSPIEFSSRGYVDIAVDAGNIMAVHPEVHVAAAKINPEDYVRIVEDSYFVYSEKDLLFLFQNSQRTRSLAQGLGTIATLKPETYGNGIVAIQATAQRRLRLMLDDPHLSVLATPDVMRAYSNFKPADLGDLARQHLRNDDVIVRATAAELLGNLPPNEVNTRALIEALPVGLRDRELNDAALAILDSLGKQKTAAANDAIKTALGSPDHLLRRKAVALLKENGVGDFSARIGTVKTRNTDADYRRAIARIGKPVRAKVETGKGSFTIEFLPEDAPLTVDNFVQLARKGYFNGQIVPRVVPNFVVQTGDPRGDQNGGPGYQIRCEINTMPYARGAVGMALSGKDTGGSQWFVTHSPQPHLDGGYTVFGRVVSGMEVVDRIVRGDVISRITISEGR